MLNFVELITNALSKVLLFVAFKRCREPWQKELVQAIDCGLDGLQRFAAAPGVRDVAIALSIPAQTHW